MTTVAKFSRSNKHAVLVEIDSGYLCICPHCGKASDTKPNLVGRSRDLTVKRCDTCPPFKLDKLHRADPKVFFTRSGAAHRSL